jgi:hypothetical protein
MKEENFKLIYKGWVKTGQSKIEYRYIFEGGWWMSGKDHDLIWKDSNFIRKKPNPNIGLSRDEETRQITIFRIPQKDNYK